MEPTDMEPTDITIKLLQEIRDSGRQTNARLEEMNAQFSQRFEVLETTLRDLAEQMVMLARGVRTAIEVLEKRLPH